MKFSDAIYLAAIQCDVTDETPTIKMEEPMSDGYYYRIWGRWDKHETEGQKIADVSR